MKGLDRIRISIVLILGIVAIGLLTWGIGKNYVELIGQASRVKAVTVQNNDTEVNSPEGTVLNLPKVTFWTCQVGVFKNEGNAQATKERLQGLGLNTGIISTNPWAVGIGLGRSAEELKGLRQSLADKGIASIPKQVALPERTFRVVGNGSKLTTELLTNVNTILQEGLTEEALVQEKQIWDTLAGDHTPTDLETLHQCYRQIAETPSEDKIALGITLFSESQRVINKFSGK